MRAGRTAGGHADDAKGEDQETHEDRNRSHVGCPASSLFRWRLKGVVKQTGVEDESPLAGNPCVALAGATLPMEALASRAVLPESVDVDDGESAVALRRDDDSDCSAHIVDEFVVREELAPCTLPAIAVVPALRKDPAAGSWSCGCWGQGQTMSGWKISTRASAF